MNQTKPSDSKIYHSLEVEMKFFIEDFDRKRTDLLRSLNLHKEITQYFFSLELTHRLQEQLIEGHQDNPTIKSFDFSKAKARVRQIKKPCGEKTFLVGFKGKKDAVLLDLGVTAKPELEIEISAERYSEFKIQADEGSISKTRSFYPFQLNNEDFILELDLINKLNDEAVEAKFIVGEIELDEDKCQQQITDLRANSLDIKIDKDTSLALCEITAGNDDEKSTLVSNRRLLARHRAERIPADLKEFFA